MNLKRSVASIRNRVDAFRAAQNDPAMMRFAEFIRRREENWARLLAALPDEFRGTVRAALAAPSEFALREAGRPVPENYWIRDELEQWAERPFAPWATMPDGFQFPREFVAWLLDPPERYWFCHCCETCGMSVPIFSHHARPPGEWGAKLAAFATCPACGGKPSYTASFQSFKRAAT